jgi:hypothetical protein
MHAQTISTVNNFVYQVWRPWSNRERRSPRHYAATCVRHLQEWSFRHSSIKVGGKESDSNSVDGIGIRLLSPYHGWRVPEGPLLKMPHTDGCETSRRTLSTLDHLVNKIIHNTGRESLNNLSFQLSFLNNF